MPLLNMKTALVLVLLIFLASSATALVPPGRITVRAIPAGALACIDTQACDTTDATFTAEGNAWHTIVVSAKGYQDWTGRVYVTSEQTSLVEASLNPDTAVTAIQVTVVPRGGTICMDNSGCQESTGSTLFAGISPGYHTLSVTAPAGYSDTTKLVQVAPGEITRTSITLFSEVIPTTPAYRGTGNIRVYIDRTGSTICIDTVDCFVNVGGTPGPGTGTVIFNEVTADAVHTISVAADGYHPNSTKVSVGQDQIATVDVRLRPLVNATAVTTTLITAQPPATRPTRAGLDVLLVVGALGLCIAGLIYRSGRK